MAGSGAEKIAREHDLPFEGESYFKTQNQQEELEKVKRDKKKKAVVGSHGTVGAVACDKDGNLAAATSTGGEPGNKRDRIGDSSMIGIGTYANNRTCAVSTTGEGEYCIRGVVAHDISAVVEYKGLSVEDACHYVVQVKNGGIDGDMGVIAIDAKCNIGISFNSERMQRAWKIEGEEIQILTFKDR